MVENSEISTKREKSSTRKISKEEALQILQQSLIEYQKAGGKLEVVPDYWHAGMRHLAIILPGVMLNDGNLSEANE